MYILFFQSTALEKLDFYGNRPTPLSLTPRLHLNLERIFAKRIDQACLCPCRELGFVNLGILRCFEILPWHISSLPLPKRCIVLLSKKVGKNAGSRRGRFHEVHNDRESPGNGCTNLGASKDFSSRTCKIWLSRNFNTLAAAKSWICGSVK